MQPLGPVLSYMLHLLKATVCDALSCAGLYDETESDSTKVTEKSECPVSLLWPLLLGE